MKSNFGFLREYWPALAKIGETAINTNTTVYIDEDGNKKTPIMIHRAIFGSFERFIGIITEHFVGVLHEAPVIKDVVWILLNVSGMYIY